MTLLAMLAIIIMMFRLVYIILENSISFAWAVVFSKEINKYYISKKRDGLIEKYIITDK